MPCHHITPPQKRDQVHTLLGPISMTLVGLPPAISDTISPSIIHFSGLVMARLGHSGNKLKRLKSSQLAMFLPIFRLSALHSWCAFLKLGAWPQQHCPFCEADQSLLCHMHLAIAVAGLAVHPCQDCRRGIDGAMLASS
jgi:hypothetical protein